MALTAKQKKLPKGLQKAIAKKTNEGIVAKDKKTGKKIRPGTPEWNKMYNKGMKKTNEEAAEGKMPSKAHIMKMWKDGKTQAEICKMHPDCDQGKLKDMIDDCMKEMKESVIKEGAEDNAELVMASKDMVDRVTGWMEDTAEMQTESMLELADAIRDEMGAEKSEAFTNAVKPALEAMYTAMESTREALTNGVGIVTGEGEPVDAIGADDPEADPAMEPTVDAEEPAVDPETGEATDDFGADAAAAGGEEEAGRETRESIERSRKIGTLLAGKKS